MTFTRENVHADQITRMREWAVSAGHHPDVFRVRPPREVFVRTDARGQR